MISKEVVEKIAGLSRLELTTQETEKMQKDLSAVLDYFDLLKSAPALLRQNAGETKKANVLRKDEVTANHDLVDGIIAGFPDKKDDYIKVKTIL